MGLLATKVFLNVYKISEGWFEVVQVLFLVWNAINDPLFGYLQDVAHCGFKWMRNRRLSILYFGPLLAVSFMIPWWSPFTYTNDTPTYIAGLHLLLALFMYDACFSFALLAWWALISEFSTDTGDRIRLIKYTQIAGLLGANGVLLIEKSSHSLQDMTAFLVVAIVFAVLGALSFIYTGLFAPDTAAQIEDFNLQPTKDENCEQNANENGRFRTGWQHTIEVFKNADFHRLVWTNFFHTIRSTAVMNFAAIFVEGLVPRTWMPLGSWRISGFYWLCSVVPKLLLIFSGSFLHHFGCHSVFKNSLLISMGAATVTFFVGRHQPWAILLFVFIETVLLDCTWTLFQVLFPDLIDADTINMKRRTPISSIIMSLNALLVKPAQSLAPMFVVAVLNRFSYREYREEIAVTPEIFLNLTSTAQTVISEQLQVNGTLPNSGLFVDTHQQDSFHELRDAMFKLMCALSVVVSFIEYFILRGFTLRNKHKREKIDNETKEKEQEKTDETAETTVASNKEPESRAASEAPTLMSSC